MPPMKTEPPSTAIKLRTPKRVLHFSDGVLEEFSDDDDDEVDDAHDENKPNEQSLVDPSTLTWGPWLWYKSWAAGSSTLAVVDYMGEFLASFFGITTPKYHFELEEYKRRQEQIKVRQEQEKGWCAPSTSSEGMELNAITSTQPKPVHV